MARILIWTGLIMGAAVAAAGPQDGPADRRQPVLVELFTSEGCSSCPPADALLAQLDRSQPIAGAQAIVLSEHVDYWNHIGWTDPYSSHAFSVRQQEYARRFATEGPYTPQMVVDGRTEFVGNDARKVESAIRGAVNQAKVPIRIGDSEGGAVIDVEHLPSGTTRKAGVFIAYAADSGDQDVKRGENQGRRLHHVAIAKEIKQVGTVDAHTAFQTRVPLARGSRLIVFAQESGNGPVWGAAMRAAQP